MLPGNIGNLNAAGFQVALWEIIADDNPRLVGLQSDLANGLVSKTASTNASIVTTAQAMLAQVDGNYGSDNFSFELFTSGKSLGQGRVAGYQDFLVVTKVPEPGMLGLLAGALGSLGLVSLGRRKAISAS